MNSVQANHVKRLDLETYFQLKSPAARQAYRFLDKRFYRSKNLEFDLRAFACEHIGLSRSYDNGKLKDKLKPCLEELESAGFLKAVSKEERFAKVRAGEWKIRLSRASNSNEVETVIEALDADAESVKSMLMQRGVSEHGAKELVTTVSLVSIQETIHYVDWLSKQPKNAPKNVPAFLVAAIRNGYAIPESFRWKNRPQTTTGKDSPTKRPELNTVISEKPNDEDDTKEIKAYLATLSPNEADAFETAAIAQGNRFSVEVYHRKKETNETLAEALKWRLLSEHRRRLSRT